MSADRRVDVVQYPSGEVKAVPAGKGWAIVQAHGQEANEQNRLRAVLMWTIIVIVLAYSVLIAENLLFGVLGAGIIYVAFQRVDRMDESDATLLETNARLRDAREQWNATPVSEVREASSGWDDRGTSTSWDDRGTSTSWDDREP